MRVEPAIPADQLAAIRAPFVETGARLIDTAILQPLGLMLDLAGETLRAQLFVVQAEGGQEACLRADFTAPIAKAHIEGGSSAGDYFYEGKVFRSFSLPSDVDATKCGAAYDGGILSLTLPKKNGGSARHILVS